MPVNFHRHFMKLGANITHKPRSIVTKYSDIHTFFTHIMRQQKWPGHLKISRPFYNIQVLYYN